MKSTLFLALAATLFFSSTPSFADSGKDCPCPPVKLMVYPIARVTFSLEANPSGELAGKYVEAQNSGTWLEAGLVKQQSDELSVYGADLQPGAEGGNTAASPDNTTPNSSVDYDSWVTVSRVGTAPNYSYRVQVTVRDTRGSETVVSKSVICTDLGEVDATIDGILSSWGPMLEVIRNYQKNLRSESNFEKLIYAHWKLDPAKTSLDIHESTPVKLHLTDCDGTPIPNREVALKVSERSLGSITPLIVVTNADGEATATFQAAAKPGVEHLLAEFIFSSVTHKDNNYATECGGHDAIAIGVPYTMSVKIGFRERADGTPPGWIEYHISGDGPLAFRTTTEDPKGSWVFLNDTALSFNHISFAISAPCRYLGPISYSSPAWMKEEDGKLVLHIGHFGPEHEKLECKGHREIAGQNANAILLGLYSYSHMGKGENITAGNEKIGQLKALAEKVQAEQAAGKSRADMMKDYKALMSAVHSQPMKPMELPGLTFNFPLPKLDPNASTVLDYTVPLDAAPKAKADLVFSNLEIKIEKTK